MIRAAPVVAAALVAAAPALTAATATAQEPDAAFAERARQAIAAAVEKRHFDPRHLDTASLVARAVEERAAGRGEEEILEEFLPAATEREYFRIGRPDAIHDGSHRYAFPYDPLVPRYLSQGPGGAVSHDDDVNLHSLDFSMPVGVPLQAARAGVVARVIDGFEPASPSDPVPDATQGSNQVIVVHEDGSWATYAHLQRAIPVAEGQRLERGVVIGLSGMSGAPEGPHLHFAVHVNRADGGHRSIPVRFGLAGTDGFIPEQGEFYGHQLEANVGLELRLDRIRMAPNRPLKWKHGQ